MSHFILKETYLLLCDKTGQGPGQYFEEFWPQE